MTSRKVLIGAHSLPALEILVVQSREVMGLIFDGADFLIGPAFLDVFEDS